jgi:redox-sensitive bicupin YhaK (pirin superfamily)
MKTIIHKSESRGNANHGWLESKHTFSFANYHNPERINFGQLRVLNDDKVAPGMGFSAHPHQNMEIISIPLEGDLEHRDSMGNVAVIQEGDVQAMSAGTGIYHSEYNKNKDKEVKFLQIWILPKVKDVEPRYDQIRLNIEDRKNRLQQIVSPNSNDDGVWIHQDAWFYLSNIEKDTSLEFHLNNPEKNGVYIFVLEGDVTVSDHSLNRRDGIGIWDVDEFLIKADSDVELLIMEVPML